jgi:hypothetical protein
MLHAEHSRRNYDTLLAQNGLLLPSKLVGLVSQLRQQLRIIPAVFRYQCKFIFASYFGYSRSHLGNKAVCAFKLWFGIKLGTTGLQRAFLGRAKFLYGGRLVEIPLDKF